MMGVSNGWQMKQGYMRPASEACSLKRYKSCDQVYRGDTSPTASQKCASGSQPAGAVPGPDGAGLSQTSNGRAGVCDRRHVDDPSSVAPPAEGREEITSQCGMEIGLCVLVEYTLAVSCHSWFSDVMEQLKY